MKTELAIKEYLNDDISLTKLCLKYKISRTHLSSKIKKMGHEITNKQNTCRIYETIFDSIDTEEKAYWLGFIYADGCITTLGNRLEIRLSSKDESHLNKFTKFIGNESSYRCGICNGNEFVHFSVRNKHLWNTLNNYGCTPRKSLTVEFPNENIFKSKDLIRHFIRGYCDGDGCLCFCYVKKRYTYIEHINFCGSYNFLIKMKEYMNISSSVRQKTNNKIHVISCSCKKAIYAAEYMYRDCNIYLDRKYNIYKQFRRLDSEGLRLLQSKNGEG